MRPFVRLLVVSLLLGIALESLPGCGGGGGSTPAAQTTPVKIDITWAPRGRVVNAPSSALSAVVTLQGAKPGGGDLAFEIDRQDAPAGYTQTYTSPSPGLPGTWTLQVNFHAGKGGQGDIVATAGKQVTIQSDGTGIGDVSTVGNIATVAVVPGQSLKVENGATDLTFTASDSHGNTIAVSQGSATFAVVSGSDVLQFNSTMQASPLKPGSATVTVAVNGLTSKAEKVSVTSNTQISVNPSVVTVISGVAHQFTATVTNAPAGASLTATWSVQEAGGGTIDPQTGIYTGPSTPGTYHVVATSVYDPSKQATVTVTVIVDAHPQPLYIMEHHVNATQTSAEHRLERMDDFTGKNWAQVFAFSDAGSGPFQNGHMDAIGADGSGNLYMTLDTESQIVRVDAAHKNTFFGAKGGGVNQFSDVHGIALDSHGRIYVADSGNNRIVRIDDITGKNWTTYQGSLSDPHGIAIDHSDRIYITDSFNSRIVRIDNITGANLAAYGSHGTGAGQFGDVVSVALDANGRIYVADYGNSRIVRMDDMNGTNWTTFGSTGAGVNQFSFPSGITVDRFGRIYVSDKGNARIVRIDDMTGKNWATFQSIPGYTVEDPSGLLTP